MLWVVAKAKKQLPTHRHLLTNQNLLTAVPIQVEAGLIPEE